MSDGPAAERWRRSLEAWAIPEPLLEAADETPWGWPPAILDRMRRDRESAAPNPTLDLVRRLLPEGGALVDVGAGSGRLSVPLAREGFSVTAIEPSDEMGDQLREAADGLPLEVIGARWPEAADRLGMFDLALSAHVVYDVADIGPFVEALHRAAGVIVIECGSTHPWSDLVPLYRDLHDLDRPSGPTHDDLIEVIVEATGRTPGVELWQASRQLRFADLQELLAFYRKRLVLPASRTAELEALLAGRVTESDGWLVVGEEARDVATMWWTAGTQ